MRSRSHPQYKESSDHGKPDDVCFRESTLNPFQGQRPSKTSSPTPDLADPRGAGHVVSSRSGWKIERCFRRSSVSNTDDHGPGSLRQAIVDANDNANVGGVPDEIDFDIPGSGLQVISPVIGLPPITDPVVIDGYTQPGSSPNTVLDGDSATLLIVLDGSLDAFADGLQLYAGNSTVRGLVINQFTIGINVSSPGGNVIEGNFIGTDATGLVDLGNTDAGIAVRDSPDNRIGGTMPEARNVISGTKVSFLNTGQGIAITGPSSIGNLVQGNFIGTDATGTQALGKRQRWRSGQLAGARGQRIPDHDQRQSHLR